MYETYVKVIKIEANTMIHMAAKHYIPTAITYTTRLAQSISAVAAACPEADLSVQRKLLNEVSARLAEASAALEQLKPLMDRVDAIQDVKEMAIAYRDRGGPRHGRPALPHRRAGADGGQGHLAGAHLRRPDVRGVRQFSFLVIELHLCPPPETLFSGGGLSAWGWRREKKVRVRKN